MIPPWRAHFGEKMMRTYITNGERTIYTSKDDADFLAEALNRSAKVESIAIPPARFYGGTIQDEIARAQIHGPNALTLEALETTLARAEAAERDFIQVHKNCIEARARAEKAETALSERKDMEHDNPTGGARGRDGTPEELFGIKPVSSEKGVSTNLLNKAYTLIEDRRNAYMHAHGSYDDSTNAWEYSGGQAHEMGFDEGMTEALDIIERVRNGG